MDSDNNNLFDHDEKCIELIGKGNLNSLKDNKLNCMRCQTPDENNSEAWVLVNNMDYS